MRSPITFGFSIIFVASFVAIKDEPIFFLQIDYAQFCNCSSLHVVRLTQTSYLEDKSECQPRKSKIEISSTCMRK